MPEVIVNPVGRPTLYREEYCKEILAFGREGMSVAEICSEWDVSKQTYYDWQAAHTEFLDATTRARDLSQSWWEKNGRINLYTEKFNTTLWIKNMHNRFRDDWYESSKDSVDHTTKGAKIGGFVVDFIQPHAQTDDQTPSGVQ